MSVFLKIVSVTYATHTHLFKPRCKSPWHVWCGQCTKFFTRCGATIGYNGLSVWTKYDRPLSIHEENLWQTLVNSWRKFASQWLIAFIPDRSITWLRENRWVQGPCLNYLHYLIPIKMRAPLIFAHLACAKMKGSKFAQYKSSKIKGRRKYATNEWKTANV